MSRLMVHKTVISIIESFVFSWTLVDKTVLYTKCQTEQGSIECTSFPGSGIRDYTCSVCTNTRLT